MTRTTPLAVLLATTTCLLVGACTGGQKTTDTPTVSPTPSSTPSSAPSAAAGGLMLTGAVQGHITVTFGDCSQPDFNIPLRGTVAGRSVNIAITNRQDVALTFDPPTKSAAWTGSGTVSVTIDGVTVDATLKGYDAASHPTGERLHLTGRLPCGF